MYFKHVHISKRKQTLCKILIFIWCFLIALHVNFPHSVFYKRNISLAKETNTKNNDVRKNGNFKIIESYEIPREKNRVAYEMEYEPLDAEAIRIIKEQYGKGDDLNTEEFMRDAMIVKISNEVKVPDPLLKPKIVKHGLEKLRRVYFLYNYARGLVPSYEKEALGWGKHVSRNTIDYIDPNGDTSYADFPMDICSLQNPLVLIIICSNPNNAILRQAIRRTWARRAYDFYNFTILFFVGTSPQREIQNMVENESELYEDIIIEKFVDTYQNLTIKTLYMLRWVQNYCKEVPFIMKTDDDVYINMENLHSYVQKAQQNDSSTFLVGKLEPKALPYRANTHKWYMPYYIYQAEYFPKYTHGVAYMMSNHVAMKLYRQSFQLKLIYFEDVFFTGICAAAVNITPIHREEFRFNTDANVNCEKGNFKNMSIVAHKVNYVAMYQLHYETYKCAVVRI